jgi:hypothetical protein
MLHVGFAIGVIKYGDAEKYEAGSRTACHSAPSASANTQAQTEDNQSTSFERCAAVKSCGKTCKGKGQARSGERGARKQRSAA